MGADIDNDMIDNDLFRIWSFSKENDESVYVCLSSDISLDEVLRFYLDNLPVTLWIASLKYNLYEVETSGFDIFREWEKLQVGGFVEECCITNNERAVLNVLRKSKKNNGLKHIHNMYLWQRFVN